MGAFGFTAIITPNPGKADRFRELFAACAESVRQNEPDVLKYELHETIPEKNDGQFIFIAHELYKDQETLDSHMQTEAVKALIAANEKEKLMEVKIYTITPGPAIKARI